MFQKILTFVAIILIHLNIVQSQTNHHHHLQKYIRKDHRQNFTLLCDFICAVVKDELDKNQEMQTVGFVELENDFPSDFSRKMLKCMPHNVSKLILNPHDHFYRNTTMKLTKQTMVIYVANKVVWVVNFSVN